MTFLTEDGDDTRIIARCWCGLTRGGHRDGGGCGYFDPDGAPASYVAPRRGDDSAGFRAAMKDAGRGGLLRG